MGFSFGAAELTGQKFSQVAATCSALRRMLPLSSVVKFVGGFAGLSFKALTVLYNVMEKVNGHGDTKTLYNAVKSLNIIDNDTLHVYT